MGNEDESIRIGEKERMSKGEREIAEFLKERNIGFIYEKEFLINDPNDKVRIIYPDFWLPAFGVVIEYFGMRGNPEYDKNIELKKKTYEENFLIMIPIYPETLKKNWKAYIMKFLKDLQDERDEILYNN